MRALGLAAPEARRPFRLSAGSASEMRRIQAELKVRGILAPYMAAYSGSRPEGLLRFATFATHTSQHIDILLDALRAIL